MCLFPDPDPINIDIPDMPPSPELPEIKYPEFHMPEFKMPEFEMPDIDYPAAPITPAPVPAPNPSALDPMMGEKKPRIAEGPGRTAGRGKGKSSKKRGTKALRIDLTVPGGSEAAGKGVQVPKGS